MNSSEYKILIADDEPDILEFVCYNLAKEGFEVSTATNGLDALKKAKEIKPHLILLDIMMPEMDGVEVCKELRAIPEFENTVIAFLTARSEDYSQIVGFEVGGDDYITKPIRPRVLISRINALLRRFNKNSNQADKHVIEVADLYINKEQFIVQKKGSEDKITLAKKEFELLSLLASKPGKVFTREEIFNKIWGSNVIVGNRTIDVHIRKIREKVGDNYIITIKGIGYKFDF
ncbi:MAG: Phosphate regulon transcriptional regulatory protein PhoB (SphR) [uncultured Aureispira sp.]|uniref:Phosphate regulon transcriptional regulatory protein PhoB (SphR) n=1 Tax=uncultured Aureispira sp. TaxID=1331704 RepID=A0A6S6UK93_9BACT|nr:MAG: Phosphate regulon transcriptional regulatory protein PhoB (SphR) [uncultured Aureispira sp.]